MPVSIYFCGPVSGFAGGCKQYWRIDQVMTSRKQEYRLENHTGPELRSEACQCCQKPSRKVHCTTSRRWASHMSVPGDLPGWGSGAGKLRREKRRASYWVTWLLSPALRSPTATPRPSFPGTNQCGVLLPWTCLVTPLTFSSFIVPPSVAALLIKIQFGGKKNKTGVPSAWSLARPHMIPVCKHKPR